MEIKKQLSKISLLDTFLFFLLLVITLNGIISIYYFSKGIPKLLIDDASWISQLLTPFVIALIQTGVNRNGFIEITNYSNENKVNSVINNVMSKFNLKPQNETRTKFIKIHHGGD